MMKNADKINIINNAIRFEKENDNNKEYIEMLKNKLKGINK